MKKQSNLSRSLTTVTAVTLTILMIPFVAMQFTREVNWSVADFIVMGALIFGTGVSYVLLNRLSPNWVYRIAIIVALGSIFLMIWANMAVGLIGSGPNAGNIMYGVIVLVAAIGIAISRFRPAGMERAMYAATLAMILLISIAFIAKMDQYPGSSATEILSVGGVFTILFCCRLLCSGQPKAQS
ncbi:hypothetical protein LWM68_21915 [Niabella sp. W65]|nr:hypothetical protein [Niabella sp. W65]MCH7365187.1 hypothetical protein [Niabella sp. W65]ULT40999.1 hypothetical protein KRR40_40830 [Niabella sp. I65]